MLFFLSHFLCCLRDGSSEAGANLNLRLLRVSLGCDSTGFVFDFLEELFHVFWTECCDAVLFPCLDLLPTKVPEGGSFEVFCFFFLFDGFSIVLGWVFI